jgi:hypothetical protein
MKINESQLRKIIQESVKNVLKENTNDLPYLSDDDIHKQYEGFKITEFSIKPRYIFGEYRWDISFGIIFPNAEHSDFDESLWENVCVYDEKGEKMAFENWYPDDITKQLIDFVRSEIQKHWPEMETLKKDQLNKEEETARSIRELMRKYNVDKNPNLNESQLRKIIRESINEIRRKKQPKTGKIQNKEGKWVDATEDGKDKYGNPMYRTHHPSITYGRECKDGSRRVQDFNFRPNVNELQLRKIIKESIQTILKESAYDINSPEYKQMYDSGNKWYDGRDTKYDHTSKEIEDYEALPDKARHPYGAEIPDFSDRIKDRWAIHDTLARKGQNSILRKQQNKREFLEMVKSFSPFFLMWCSSNKGMSKEEVKTLPDKELISLYRQYLIHGHEGRRRPI